jgi:hypothetical protein
VVKTAYSFAEEPFCLNREGPFKQLAINGMSTRTKRLVVF